MSTSLLVACIKLHQEAELRSQGRCCFLGKSPDTCAEMRVPLRTYLADSRRISSVRTGAAVIARHSHSYATALFRPCGPGNVTQRSLWRIATLFYHAHRWMRRYLFFVGVVLKVIQQAYKSNKCIPDENWHHAAHVPASKTVEADSKPELAEPTGSKHQGIPFTAG